MDVPYQYETLDALVGRIFSIEDITLGTQKQDFIVRYRGHLRQENSEEAYDWLSNQVKGQALTPLFRWDGDRQAIILVQSMPKGKAPNPWINLILFILTLCSVLFVGMTYGLDQPLPSNPLQAVWVIVRAGWPFAVSLLAILLSHEFGHYLMGRFHGVNVTLPYLIPFPVYPFGTLGAFINMKEPARNRKVLLDIAVAGPLAGFVVAVPILIFGLIISKVDTIAAVIPQGATVVQEGNSLLYLAAKYLVFGKLLPAPVSYGAVSPLLYWLRYFFTGQPLPLGGLDVMISPVAMAGWAGLLVTALNLIPAGQLDGGHLLYVLLGKVKALKIWPIILVALVGLGLIWNGWWLWAVLIFMFGRIYAEPLDQITPLDNRRKVLAILTLSIFILVFTPIPLMYL